MLAGIVTPPLILGGAGGANLDQDTQQYLISASLIVCGILSAIQITRFHFYKTPYYLGTGLIRYATNKRYLMIVLLEHPLLQSQSPLEHLRNGTQTERAPQMHRVIDFLVQTDTVLFSGRLVCAHYLKSG